MERAIKRKRNTVFILFLKSIICEECIFEKHCNRHGANSSWYRRVRTIAFESCCIKVSVSLSIDYRTSYIDNHCIRTYHILPKDSFFPRCHNNNIRILRKLRKILCLTVTECNSSTRIRKEEREWFPNDIRSTEDGNIFSRDVYMIVIEHSFDPLWSTANNPFRFSEKEISDSIRSKAINIFFWINMLNNVLIIHMSWNRGLYNNSMNLRICIELFDGLDEFFLCDRGFFLDEGK